MMTPPSPLDHQPLRVVPMLDPSLPAPEEYDALCESCGYSLIALAGDRCPECGATFDPVALPLARIPWLYRGRLGIVPAFLVTSGRILTRPYAFAKELTRPVRISLADARSFSAVCVRLAAVVTVLAGVACVLLLWSHGALRSREISPISMAVLFGAGPVWLFFAFITDLPTFIWAGLEQKPDALAPPHYYASAPLIFVPLSALVTVAACWSHLAQGAGSPLSQGLLIAILALGLIMLLYLWVIAQRFAAASGVPMLRRVFLGLYLPIHWLMGAFICVVMIAFIFAGAQYLA